MAQVVSRQDSGLDLRPVLVEFVMDLASQGQHLSFPRHYHSTNLCTYSFTCHRHHLILTIDSAFK